MIKEVTKLMPKTILGRWSLGLIVAMPILFFVGASLTNSMYASVPAGNSILEDISGRPALAFTMLTGTISGVSAFITGLIGVWKLGERSFLVYISTVFGALLLLFLLGEFTSPH